MHTGSGCRAYANAVPFVRSKMSTCHWAPRGLHRYSRESCQDAELRNDEWCVLSGLSVQPCRSASSVDSYFESFGYCFCCFICTSPPIVFEVFSFFCVSVCVWNSDFQSIAGFLGTLLSWPGWSWTHTCLCFWSAGIKAQTDPVLFCFVSYHLFIYLFLKRGCLSWLWRPVH